MAPRVLISDSLSPAAIAIFKERGVEVDFQPLLRPFHADLDRPMLGAEFVAHGAAQPSSLRASSTSMIGMPSRMG